MVRILVLANSDIGLYKFRKELLEELAKSYEVHISLPDGEFIPHLTELGCHYIDTPIDRRGTKPVTDLKLLLHYKKIIKQIKPNIVLTYTIKPNVYGGIACIMTQTPYICNITGLGSAVENGGLIKNIALLLYKNALKKADVLFFQNKENERLFKNKNMIYCDSRLIPGSGVNLEYYNLLEYPRDDKIEFVFISRIMKEKGIEQYLEAADYITKNYHNTKFHIVGFCEEDYEHKLKEMEYKGVAKYHGMQRDVRVFLRKTHCTIHPTFYPEGLSNVLLESAACGRPIITTNRSGCREVVENGINGYIVEAKNSVDLIKKIEQFIMLPYEDKKRMGLASRDKVVQEFDRKIVVNAYMEEISKCLKVQLNNLD